MDSVAGMGIRAAQPALLGLSGWVLVRLIIRSVSRAGEGASVEMERRVGQGFLVRRGEVDGGWMGEEERRWERFLCIFLVLEKVVYID